MYVFNYYFHKSQILDIRKNLIFLRALFFLSRRSVLQYNYYLITLIVTVRLDMTRCVHFELQEFDTVPPAENIQGHRDKKRACITTSKY